MGLCTRPADMGTTVVELQSRVFEYSRDSVGMRGPRSGHRGPFEGEMLAELSLCITPAGLLIHLWQAGNIPRVLWSVRKRVIVDVVIAGRLDSDCPDSHCDKEKGNVSQRYFYCLVCETFWHKLRCVTMKMKAALSFSKENNIFEKHFPHLRELFERLILLSKHFHLDWSRRSRRRRRLSKYSPTQTNEMLSAQIMKVHCELKSTRYWEQCLIRFCFIITFNYNGLNVDVWYGHEAPDDFRTVRLIRTRGLCWLLKHFHVYYPFANLK